jgi:hypothetical protein
MEITSKEMVRISLAARVRLVLHVLAGLVRKHAPRVAVPLAHAGLDALAFLWRAFALSVLWTWFVQPTFPSVPALNLAHAAGLALVVRFLVTNAPLEIVQAEFLEISKRERHTAAFGLPAVALMLGWAVHSTFPV